MPGEVKDLRLLNFVEKRDTDRIRLRSDEDSGFMKYLNSDENEDGDSPAARSEMGKFGEDMTFGGVRKRYQR